MGVTPRTRCGTVRRPVTSGCKRPRYAPEAIDSAADVDVGEVGLGQRPVLEQVGVETAPLDLHPPVHGGPC